MGAVLVAEGVIKLNFITSGKQVMCWPVCSLLGGFVSRVAKNEYL